MQVGVEVSERIIDYCSRRGAPCVCLCSGVASVGACPQCRRAVVQHELQPTGEVDAPLAAFGFRGRFSPVPVRDAGELPLFQPPHQRASRMCNLSRLTTARHGHPSIQHHQILSSSLRAGQSYVLRTVLRAPACMKLARADAYNCFGTSLITLPSCPSFT
jgi:hypothetical protein